MDSGKDQASGARGCQPLKTEVMQKQDNHKIAESRSAGSTAADMNDQSSNMDEFQRKMDAIWSTLDSLLANLDQWAGKTQVTERQDNSKIQPRVTGARAARV